MALRTTAGQALLNDLLPPDLRDYRRELDAKKGLPALLGELAAKHPEKYREVTHRLMELAKRVAQDTAGYSFGVHHLLQTPSARRKRLELRRKIEAVLDDRRLPPAEKEARILELTAGLQATQADEILQESLAERNPLAYLVLSGARGSKQSLTRLRGSDLLYVDHRGRVIPFPVMRSFSRGLSPAEYWASAYGTRKSSVDTKLAVRDAGYLGKVMMQVVHRQIVTADDAEEPADTVRGLPADVDDPDNEGALLAYDVVGYPRDTVLTPKILADLKRKGVKRILLRSPAVGGPPDGGLYAKDVGVREHGRLPYRGENVSVAAVQALAEPLSQGMLSAKHSGGVAGSASQRTGSLFDVLERMVQVPRTFQEGATHAEVDGTVSRVEKAPAGGWYVWIDETRHYVPEDRKLLVKRGDRVEAGDVLSDGQPNPAVIVRHKGIGEGRRYFAEAVRRLYRDAGMRVNRRNAELLARGLINHVRLAEETDYGLPDDVVPYQSLEANWEPRQGSRPARPREALGKYLEKPYLHYTIGTKVRPSVVKELEDWGVREVLVHDEPPPFEPEMIRGEASLQFDPDWMTRLYGSGLKKSLLEATWRGATSTESGTSFVPGLARAVDFGEKGKVRIAGETT